MAEDKLWCGGERTVLIGFTVVYGCDQHHAKSEYYDVDDPWFSETCPERGKYRKVVLEKID